MNQTKNNITGDSLISKPQNDLYRNNFDVIFRKDKKDEGVKDGATDDIAASKNDKASGNSAPVDS